MARVIRVVLLFVLLGILAFLVWLRVTPAGQDLADVLSDRWQQARHGGEERDAVEKLTALGARFGRSAPPEQHFVSIDCKNNTLGDEGYRLVGKCFRLQAAKFLECDLNDDRMQYLAGLRNLTSLTISDTPEVTDAGIKKIAGLRELTSVLLRGTHVGDLCLPSIVKLPDLRVLDLSRTQVTDDGMSALAHQRTLTWLLIMDTAVTDEGVARLEGLSSLQNLTLKGSKVTDKGKARLLEMYPALKID